jgi:hypothetical protein
LQRPIKTGNYHNINGITVFVVGCNFFFYLKIPLPEGRGSTIANQKRVYEAPGQIAHNARTCMCSGEGTPKSRSHCIYTELCAVCLTKSFQLKSQLKEKTAIFERVIKKWVVQNLHIDPKNQLH